METIVRSHGRGAALLLMAAALAALAGCSDATSPSASGETQPVPAYDFVPTQSLFSMNTASFSAVVQTTTAEATGGKRWCTQATSWFQPEEELCAGVGETPPFGMVTDEEGDMLVTGDISRAAPFVWTGPPERPSPFPATGDFTLDIRLKVDQLARYGTGLYATDWNPAGTEGANTPLRPVVFQIWADSRGHLRASLLGVAVAVREPLASHAYHLVYEDGAYTLFVDEAHVAGPIVSDARPSALWMGNPVFVERAGDWTDFRISQFTVGTPAPEVLEVPVDVKPGDCPSPFALRSQGILPLAIPGTEELPAEMIDGSTLQLEGVPVERHALEDVTGPPLEGGSCPTGPDGRLDLTAKFPARDVAARLDEAVDGEERLLALTGSLKPSDGAPGAAIAGGGAVIVKR